MLFIFFKKWLAIKYDIIDAKNAPKLRESDVHYLYNSNIITLLLAQKRKIIVSADINITVKDLVLEIMRIWFDGVKSCLKYIDEMCEEIDHLETLNTNRYLKGIKRYQYIYIFAFGKSIYHTSLKDFNFSILWRFSFRKYFSSFLI